MTGKPVNSCKLSIKVIPSSSRDSVTGWLGDVLKLKVRAPADKGRANKAVEELLAKRLGLASSLITIVRGHTAEVKIVEISSLTHDELLRLLPSV
jgi:uncharacterized protein (TIGR00251 family)